MFRAVVFSIGATVILGCSPQSAETRTATSQQVIAATFNLDGAPTVAFSVPDMMCVDGCAVAVKEILAKQPGVKDVVVDFDAKTATVAVEEVRFDAQQALAALVDKRFDNSSLKSGEVAKPREAVAPAAD